MSDFLKVEITTKVNGYKVNSDEGTCQIQNISINEKGKLIRNTIKLHKPLGEKELSQLVGKVIKLSGVKEYGDFKKVYSATDLKMTNETNDIFKVDKEMRIKINNITDGVDSKDNKSFVVFQSVVQDNGNIKLIDLKLKNRKLSDYKEFKGKNILAKNVRVSQFNGNTFYSIEDAPVAI